VCMAHPLPSERFDSVRRPEQRRPMADARARRGKRHPAEGDSPSARRNGTDIEMSAAHSTKRPGGSMSQSWPPSETTTQQFSGTTPPATSEPDEATVKLSRGQVLTGAVGAFVLVLAAGAGGYAIGHSAATSSAAASASASAAAASSSADGRLRTAFDDCRAQDSTNTMQLDDDGATIVVDTRSQYGSVSGVTCVWSHLKTPSSVSQRVSSTTALQGQQTATHDGISYSWSYHPKNGLNMVITLSD